MPPIVERAAPYILAAYISLLTWTGLKQVERIDRLESETKAYISRAEFSEELRKLQEQLSESNKRLDRIFTILVTRSNTTDVIQW